MPAIDGRRGARRARRWPTALVAVVAAGALALAGFLIARDRQNADAASSSRANAGQDAIALATLQSLVRTLRYDATLRHAGVLGFKAIAVHDVETLVVTPLGGTVEMGQGQWTLALGGGYACLTWGRPRALPVASRGACGDSVPLVATAVVTPTRFREAVASLARRERAALDAAATASTLSLVRDGATPRYSMPLLTARFSQLDAAPFRSWATPWGVTVHTSASVACLLPSASQSEVRVLAGACP